MALTPTAAIPDTLLAYVAAFAEEQSPEIAVAFPDLPFTPIDGEAYLDIAYLPNRTETRAVGANDAQRHLGLLQVSIMWPAGHGGLIPASDLAGAVLAHFAKGTRLYGDGVAVLLNRKGWVAPHLQEPDRLRLPVTIPYECFSA